MFWLLIAEIYPLRIRGAAMSVASMANWGANFVVTVSFLTLLNAISGVGVFFLFGFLTLVALAYFWKKVPETKGRSLQEIERDLVPAQARPVRLISGFPYRVRSRPAVTDQLGARSRGLPAERYLPCGSLALRAATTWS